MLNVLTIHASPCRDRNSDTMLSRYVDALAQSATIQETPLYVSELTITPCTACDACRENGVCPIDDDMGSVIQMLMEADIVVVATPVYFCSVPAALKCLIDRCQPLYYRKYLHNTVMKKKKGVLLACCENEINDPFTGVEKPIEAFFFSLHAEFVDRVYGVLEGTPIASLPDVCDQLKTHGLALGSTFL